MNDNTHLLEAAAAVYAEAYQKAVEAGLEAPTLQLIAEACERLNHKFARLRKVFRLNPSAYLVVARGEEDDAVSVYAIEHAPTPQDLWRLLGDETISRIGVLNSDDLAEMRDNLLTEARSVDKTQSAARSWLRLARAVENAERSGIRDSGFLDWALFFILGVNDRRSLRPNHMPGLETVSAVDGSVIYRQLAERTQRPRRNPKTGDAATLTAAPKWPPEVMRLLGTLRVPNVRIQTHIAPNIAHGVLAIFYNAQEEMVGLFPMIIGADMIELWCQAEQEPPLHMQVLAEFRDVVTIIKIANSGNQTGRDTLPSPCFVFAGLELK